MQRRRLWQLLLGLNAALSAMGCGSSASNGMTPPPAGGGGDRDTIDVRNNSFAPTTVTVSAGATVVFSWAPGDVSHNVTFDDGTHSPTQNSGTYRRTFMTAGSYKYRCTIHAPAMAGTIVVQ